MKAIRVLLVFFVVLAVVYVGVEIVGTGVAEDRLASVVQRELKLDQKPTLTVSGFPVVLRALVFGDISAVSFEATDVTIEGMKVRRASGRFEGLHAKDLLNPRELDVEVGRGTVSVEVVDAALGAYLARKDVDAKIRVREGSISATVVRSFFGRPRTIVGRGVVRIEGDSIVFDPRTVTVDGERVEGAAEAEAKRRARFSVKMPTLPGGVRAERVEMHAGFVRVLATIEGKKLRFG